MIREIHYFSTELIRKLMSSQGAALNIAWRWEILPNMCRDPVTTGFNLTHQRDLTNGVVVG